VHSQGDGRDESAKVRHPQTKSCVATGLKMIPPRSPKFQSANSKVLEKMNETNAIGTIVGIAARRSKNLDELNPPVKEIFNLV
jgi:hypothetical protein